MGKRKEGGKERRGKTKEKRDVRGRQEKLWKKVGKLK